MNHHNLLSLGLGSAQRTKSQKYYWNKDPEKALASKIDAIFTVMVFIENTYHACWKSDDKSYDSKYKSPDRNQIKDALLQMEKRLGEPKA